MEGRYNAILKYRKNECNILKNAKISIVLPWHFYLFKSSKNKKSAFRRAVFQLYIFTVAKIVHFQGQFRFFCHTAWSFIIIWLSKFNINLHKIVLHWCLVGHDHVYTYYSAYTIFLRGHTLITLARFCLFLTN